MSASGTVDGLVVPEEALTLDGFCRWVESLGEQGSKVHFYEGKLEFETSPQDNIRHAPAIAEVSWVLRQQARSRDLGRWFGDRNWITNHAAILSTEPDGFFVRWRTSRRARLAGC